MHDITGEQADSNLDSSDKDQLVFDLPKKPSTSATIPQNLNIPNNTVDLEENVVPSKEATANKKGVLLKMSAVLASLALVGAGAFTILKGGGEAESTAPADVPETSAPYAPVPPKDSPQSETSSDNTETVTTLEQMLESYVDKNGMPNKKIDLKTNDPEEALAIYHHNFACAINTRNPECVNDITTVDNPVGVLDKVRDFGDKGYFFKFDLNEVFSVEKTELGGYIIKAGVTGDTLSFSNGFPGHGYNPYIREYELAWSEERGLTVSSVKIVDRTYMPTNIP